MITVPELAAAALGSYLTPHMSRFHGAHSVGRSSAPATVSAVPQRRTHVLVTLVGYDIMKKRSLRTSTSASDYAHLIVACTLHDIGDFGLFVVFIFSLLGRARLQLPGAVGTPIAGSPKRRPPKVRETDKTSLLSRANSLLPQRKFPAPMHREFGSERPKSLAEPGMEEPEEGPVFREFPVQFLVKQGNCFRDCSIRTVSSAGRCDLTRSRD
jgi:hypothetical protein